MVSTVATVTNAFSITYPFQRKTFYANGRFWCFYYSNADTMMRFKTSTNGVDWSASTDVRACSSGIQFSVWFDGTYTHYACMHTTIPDYVLYYRRGTPNADGTITWSAAEQTVYAGTSTDYHTYPCIAVDDGGHAWIGTKKYISGSEYPFVFRNANTDGTWSDTAAFPYQLSIWTSSAWGVIPVVLTSEKVYAVYCRSSDTPKGQLYNAGWGAEESDLADYNSQMGQAISAVAEGDHVHFVYNRQTTYQIRYNKRTSGVGWAANDVLVSGGMESTTRPALAINTVNNDLYCFWARKDTDHLYYKKYSGGAWDAAATDWIDESADTLYDAYVLTSFAQAYSTYIGVLYSTKSVSPFNVKFEFLTLAAPPAVTVKSGGSAASAMMTAIVSGRLFSMVNPQHELL